MMHAWSTFLSCDARDMCRSGPALARVVFTWIAVAVRIVTLWLAVTVSVPSVGWLYGAVYWGSRLNDPDYLEFLSLRDEARREQETWARGERADELAREEAVRLAASFRRWSESRTVGYELFMEDWDFVEAERCPPFRSREGFFELLEAPEQEDGRGYASCNYLMLLH